MKVRPSVKPICDKCKVIKRHIIIKIKIHKIAPFMNCGTATALL